MKPRQTGVLLLTAIALAAPGVAAHAAPVDTVATMVSDGTANLSFRYRFEGVEQDNALRNAEASTLKTRLTLKTGTVAGFTALMEVDDVMTLGTDSYNSTRVDDRHFGVYSVVADPVGTEINQAWLKYAFSPVLSATGGRQRINHAGQRFVGGVAWRQNEQTYDALGFSYGENGITVDYSYLWRVNRIFAGTGTSIQPTGFDSDSHILMAAMPVAGGKLSGFVYALDLREVPGLSSITYGVAYDGAFDPFAIAASVATQSDYGDNSISYDALFLSLEGKVKLQPVTLIGGYELLGSDDGRMGFATPLATLHKFQGWADLFLTTPANGIEDLYLGISANAGAVALGAYYHDFSADEGSTDYGSELNLVATWSVNKHIAVELKYADYSAAEFGVDTGKVWCSVMANF